MSARDFTMTEQLDIESHEMTASGYLWLEDSYAVTENGDRLEAVSDNLYRVTWATFREEPAYTEYADLSEALKAMDLAE